MLHEWQLKIIEPGAYKTNFADSSMSFFGISNFEDYKNRFNKFTQAVTKDGSAQNENISEVADKIFEAATDNKVQLRYPKGATALLLLEAKQKMDDTAFQQMLAKQMGL